MNIEDKVELELDRGIELEQSTMPVGKMPLWANLFIVIAIIVVIFVILSSVGVF